ncbi:MAG TPA: c-type cytochrome [Solirubrobacteraceae bacterium]|nr:c-type cytochrome [Solirubrobacteraceae bacterium]
MIGGWVRTALLAAVAVVSLTGCELKDDGNNLVNGKTLFVQRCAACHTLARADAKGVVGPSLDEAWQQSERDGLGRSTYEGLVHGQILHPNRNPSIDRATGKEVPPMPAMLVKGDDAQDVAAYVASAAAKPGKDTGRLAAAGAPEQQALAEAQGGKLEIPADPNGALAYTFKDAEAPAGQLEIDSPNESSTPHDISLEGGGVNEKGEVVQDGGTSMVNVDLQPGDYTFYCSVPGHREGGMEGKLTVK